MSKITPKFRARVEQGRVLMEGMIKDTFDGFLKTLEGEEVFVVVRKPGKDYPQRSNSENRYFHGVILPILSEHLGYSTDEIKDILKAKFLSSPVTVKGVEMLYIKPTSSLTTVEFEKFCEKIREWSSADLGCYLPEPNEVIND